MTTSDEAMEMMQCARCGRFSGPEVLCARCDHGPEEWDEEQDEEEDDLNAEADAAAAEIARDVLDGVPDW